MSRSDICDNILIYLNRGFISSNISWQNILDSSSNSQNLIFNKSYNESYKDILEWHTAHPDACYNKIRFVNDLNILNANEDLHLDGKLYTLGNLINTQGGDIYTGNASLNGGFINTKGGYITTGDESPHGGHIYSKGGFIYSEGGNIELAGGHIYTGTTSTAADGGNIYTDGGHIILGGGTIYTQGGSIDIGQDGNLLLRGGTINTQGGNLDLGQTGTLKRNGINITTTTELFNTSNNVRTSDDQLKNNATDISNALESIMKLKPQIYDFKSSEEPDAKHVALSSGFIAQDVLKIPELAHAVNVPENNTEYIEQELDESGNILNSVKNNKNYLSLDYTTIFTHAVKAIQELNNEVKNLKAKI